MNSGIYWCYFGLMALWGLGCSDTAGHVQPTSSSSDAGRILGSAGSSGAASGAGVILESAAGAADAAASAGAAGSDLSETSAAGALPQYPGTTTLEVPVLASGRVYLQLAEPSLVTPSGDPATSTEWDLAFEGFSVYTNSGPSGAGQGAAFGPLELSSLLGDTAPTVPFLSPDKAGGAFVDWYAYDGTSHALYSRFHVYGVKRADRLWKVQILSYYSEADNTAVSALYRLRYAELGETSGITQTIQVDGTAGGLAGPADAPSGCLDLASGQVTPLTPSEALASTAWDLCFRRDSISVNGEAGGPSDVGASDLEAAQSASELLATVEKENADGELALFDASSAASFVDSTFRGDHVVSAFETGGWFDPTTAPPTVSPAAWLVQDALGESQFLIAFSALRTPTTSSAGTVVIQIKPVK